MQPDPAKQPRGHPWTPEQRNAWDAFQRAKEQYEKTRQARERAEDREQDAEMQALLARKAAKDAFGGDLPLCEPEGEHHG